MRRFAEELHNKRAKRRHMRKYVKILAAISYNKGIIQCESYEQMTGKYFATFSWTHFNDIFEDAGKDSNT